jgi:hypothetical protein
MRGEAVVPEWAAPAAAVAAAGLQAGPAWPAGVHRGGRACQTRTQARR